MDTEHIDELLERYLYLLDQYTELRAELGSLQIDMYQNIARANFTAERGMRYGRDFYDDRMQASRTVSITVDAHSVPRFETADHIPPENEKAPNEKPKPTKSLDPLRWYGLLAPMPLRQAQTQAVQLVQQVIPKLATVNAEMLDLEIEVRRARKKRAKAETATATANEATESTPAITAAQLAEV
jgi:coiled-coil domain-containing protein 115